MARSPDQPKRPMTQAQLDVLARSNPTVAKRMKEGYYKDRMAGSAPAPTRKRRARTAQLPGETRANPGNTRTRKPGGTGKAPGATRTRKPGATRKKTGSNPGEQIPPSRPGGFWKGLLGGG